LASTHTKFEIIFVSSDRDVKSFNEYFGSMPWIALSFDDSVTKSQLATKFSVSGIPRFVMLDPSGKVINDNARTAVANGQAFPFAA